MDEPTAHRNCQECDNNGKPNSYGEVEVWNIFKFVFAKPPIEPREQFISEEQCQNSRRDGFERNQATAVPLPQLRHRPCNDRRESNEKEQYSIFKHDLLRNIFLQISVKYFQTPDGFGEFHFRQPNGRGQETRKKIRSFPME